MNRGPKRSIVITGTSTGIGRAAALRLAADGWRVFAGVRRLEDGEALALAAGANLVPLILEVTDAATIAAAAKEVEAAVGGAGLDALVNNAGFSVGGPLELQETDELRQQFEVNVFGLMAVTRALLPLLKRARGRVVNISSGAGKVASPLLGAYCASKFAVEALSDALRLELRHAGVRVSLVEPGLIRTPFVAKGREDATLRRAGWPAEAEAYYGPRVERTLAQIDRLERRGSEPDAVAQVIQRALDAPNPRSRYAAGNDVKLMLTLLRILPDGMLGNLMARFTGF